MEGNILGVPSDSEGISMPSSLGGELRCWKPRGLFPAISTHWIIGMLFNVFFFFEDYEGHQASASEYSKESLSSGP